MADDALWDLLASATVRICGGDGEVMGSGFFVEPRRVLTVAHVAENAKGPLSLTLHDGQRCTIVNVREALPRQRQPGRSVWPLPDLAVLSVDDEWLDDSSTPFVEMTDRTPSGELFVSGAAIGLVGDIVDDRVRLQYEATRNEAGFALHKLTGSSVAPGMSGGPVLDPRLGKVVGLIKADRGQNDGAFVVAATSIAVALPALWASHLEAHRRDPRWRVLVTRTRYANLEPDTLIQYLEAVRDEYRTSPMLPGDLQRAQVRQPTRVRPRLAIGTQIDVGQRGGAASDDQEAESIALTGEAFLWDPLRSPWKSVAIVAGPGMGKTWLLTNHAVALAEQSLERVRESPELRVEVRLPILVNAAAFARRLDADPDADQVIGALSATLQRSLRSAPDRALMAEMLGLALDDTRVVLCVDGLDEVPDDLRERLRAALAMLEPRLAQLVASGRESARVTLERVFGGEHEEFELTGFASGDVRRFVRSWHRTRQDLARRVERTLRDSPRLRTLVRVPLLLTFVCRLAETDLRFASTRSGLCRDVALGVLSGRWRGPEPARTDPVLRLRLLSAAVGPLAAPWRSRPDEFSEAEVEMAVRSQPGYIAAHAAAVRRWQATEGAIDRIGQAQPESPVLWEFLHDGLLIQTQGPYGEQLLRFSHLVFGELCVAMWLAFLTDEEHAEQIELHRWFDSHWTEIIPMACGVAPDPATLLRQLPVLDDDPWLTQAQLLANCMVEAPRAPGREAVDSLVGTLIARLQGGPASDAQVARQALTILAIGRVEHASTRLAAALRNRELPPEHKGFAMRLLCEVGESYAIAKCKEIVADPRAPQADRDEAARALCRSGDQAGVEIVIASFATQSGTYGRLAVALASGETSSEAALALVRRRDVHPALRVAVAIEQLQVNGIETAAVELLLDPTLGLTGQVALTVALLRVGQPVDSEQARELVENPNVTYDDRLELVHALLLRGEFSALPAATDLVIDLKLDHRRRRSLAQTMMSAGREGSQALYVSATRRSAPPAARLQALLALIERRHLGGASAAAAMIADGEGERWVQAQLLGSLFVHMPQIVDQQAVVGMLADRDLTDGDLHASWEHLATEALRAGDSELREQLRQRIKRRVEHTVEHTEGDPDELSRIDVERLLTLLSESGVQALDLVVEIASNGAASVDARIYAAMTAVIADVARVDELEGLLEDPGLADAVRERLAVAFAMLGAPRMLPRIIAMMPGSEPAYVGLRSVLQGNTITRETALDCVRRGREAVSTLRAAPPVTWDLDFSDVARGIGIEARSATERTIREDWLTDEIRSRTYRRLLSLLLPAERLALHRVGGFIDSDATRNWLATWIPAYRSVATAEAIRIPELIRVGKLVPPSVGPGSPVRPGPFEVLAHTSMLLHEWWALLLARRWPSCIALMAGHQDLFETALPEDLNHLANNLDPSWPSSAIRNYLLNVAIGDGGVSRARLLLSDDLRPLDVARAHLDAGDAVRAFGAASFAVFQSPDDAAGFFYAAEALLLAERAESARELMSRSAALASGRQAAQGRRTLQQFGRRHGLPPELIDEMRGILGTVLKGDQSRLEDDADHGEVDDRMDLQPPGAADNSRDTDEGRA